MRGDIFAAGVIIMVGAVLAVMVLSSLDDGGRDIHEDHRMLYGDYVEIDPEGILGTDGPFEIVERDGTTLLHATGTGVGSVVRSSGADYWKAERASAILVVMDGQSNAAYHNANASLAPATEPGTAWYFGYPDRMPSGLTEDVSACRYYDFVGPDGASRVGDKGPALCKELHELTGKKVVWVSLGIPGHKLAEWDEGGACWNQNANVMAAAMPMIPDGLSIDETWIVWQQGESDYLTSTSPAVYKQKFKDFHDLAPSEWGVKGAKWMIMQGNPTNMGAINGALAELAEELDCVLAPNLSARFTTDNGLMGSDELHYTQKGDNAIGAGAAWTMAEGSGRAPVYLVQRTEDCDLGDTVTLGVADGYGIDGSMLNVAVTWASTPDTSSYGISTIAGTTSTSGILLEGTVDPVAVVRVGYLGYSEGFELMRNADGLTIIGRDSASFGSSMDIPGTIDGTAVTEIAENALRRGPWNSLTIPDSVTSIGDYGFYNMPYVHTVTIGDGLETLGTDAFQLTFIKNGETIAKSAWTADPSLIQGSWAWDGHTRVVMYYQGVAP